MITHPKAVLTYLRGMPIREYTAREICDGMKDYWISAHLDGHDRMMYLTRYALDRLHKMGYVKHIIYSKKKVTWMLIECSTD